MGAIGKVFVALGVVVVATYRAAPVERLDVVVAAHGAAVVKRFGAVVATYVAAVVATHAAAIVERFAAAVVAMFSAFLPAFVTAVVVTYATAVIADFASGNLDKERLLPATQWEQSHSSWLTKLSTPAQR